jgi:sigma-B regulation protein RsbU (phosphoserine phosphatase)
VSASITKHNGDALNKLAALEKEIETSAKIQASLLPGNHLNSKHVLLYSYIKPAAKVSGDFYDFFWLDKYRLAIVIADVSGKNISASLLASMTKGLYRACARIYTDPLIAISKVNDCFTETNRSVMFVTSIYGILNIQSGTFEYINAGHLPIVLINDGQTKFSNNTIIDVALGVDGKASFTKNQIAFNDLDKILLYTDGVTEAMNARNDEFGEERLLRVCSSKQALSPKDLTKQVALDIRDFVGKAAQSDDITIMCLQYRKG